MAGSSKGRQRTLEDVLGPSAKCRVRIPVGGAFPTDLHSSPSSGSKTKSKNKKEEEDEEDEDEDEDDLPIRIHGRLAKRSIHWSDPQSQSSGPAAPSSPYQVSTSRAVAQSSPVVRSRRRVLDSDDEEESSDGTIDGTRTAPSPKSSRLSHRAKNEVVLDDNSDEDVPAPGPSASEGKGIDAIQAKDDDDEGDEGDDQDVRPTKRRRRAVQLEDSGDDKNDNSDSDSEPELGISTPSKRASRLAHANPTKTIGTRSARKGPRSLKQKQMELLRRRRMGEKVTMSDLESSASDEEGHVALYDKDPDHVALSDFDDDEEEEVLQTEKRMTAKEVEKAKKKKQKKQKKEEKHREREEEARERQLTNAPRSGFEEEGDLYDYGFLETTADVPPEDDDGEMADFIDDSHAGLIGMPDDEDSQDIRHQIPLQFTSQAHKPLKSHFKDAVEWLVHRRIDPGGRTAGQPMDELYQRAWDRLDRELGGLAQSRFISSIWTAGFQSALRARPYMDNFDIRAPGRGPSIASTLGPDGSICQACGRSGHPPSFKVMLQGTPYDTNTLEDVESDAEEDEDDEEDEEDGSDSSEDVKVMSRSKGKNAQSEAKEKKQKKSKDDKKGTDMHGHSIAPASQPWYVGVVCHSNATTAHELLHWRRALKDWVEDKLQAEKLLTPAQLAKRDAMKARQRRALANEIVDDWDAGGTISSLFGDFMKMLEEARTKSTAKPSRYGR